jgi:histone-arginine methyltransferase CARM1
MTIMVEPLAVNAFETIRGWIRMVANPMRSYDIRAELVIGSAQLSDPNGTFPPESTRQNPNGFSRRTGQWALHEQTYYFDQVSPDAASKPEYAGLYQPETGQAIDFDFP